MNKKITFYKNNKYNISLICIISLLQKAYAFYKMPIYKNSALYKKADFIKKKNLCNT